MRTSSDFIVLTNAANGMPMLVPGPAGGGQ